MNTSESLIKQMQAQYEEQFILVENNEIFRPIAFDDWWEGTSQWKNWFNFELAKDAKAILEPFDIELRLAALSNIYSEKEVIEAIDLNWDKVYYVKDLKDHKKKYGKDKAIVLRALEMPAFVARAFLGMPPKPGADHPIDNNYSAILCPQYSGLNIKYAHMVASGKKPVDICQRLLTSREAHDYFTNGGPSPYVDMNENVNSYLTSLLPNLPYKVHYLEVLRWLMRQQEIGHWSILTKNRLIHGAYMGSFIEYIDEIEPEDLTLGVKTGVYHAFANSQKRIEVSNPGSDRVISRNVFGDLPYGVSLLDTSNKLNHEGRHMHHCVGSYHRRVEEGKSYIFSIRSYHQKSTLELVREENQWKINQHKSFKNSAPCERHMKLANLWVAKLNDPANR